MAFYKFKKGSAEAKAHMARIRAMRGKKTKSNPRKRKVRSMYRTPGRLKRSQKRFIANWKINPRKKNPVRKLSGSRQARKLRALRAQVHRKGMMIPTRALYDVKALRKMARNPRKRKARPWNLGNVPIYKKKRRKIARNPAKRSGVWKDHRFYVVANYRGKLGFLTDAGTLVTESTKARDFTIKDAALIQARRVERSPGVNAAGVVSGDATLQQIRGLLGL